MKRIVSGVCILLFFLLISPSIVGINIGIKSTELIIYTKTVELQKEVRNGHIWSEDATISVGDLVEFRIKAKNTGFINVDNVKIEDILPSQLLYVSSNPVAQIRSNVVSWITNFTGGETKYFYVTARATSTSTSFTNTVYARWNNYVIGRDTANLTIKSFSNLDIDSEASTEKHNQTTTTSTVSSQQRIKENDSENLTNNENSISNTTPILSSQQNNNETLMTPDKYSDKKTTNDENNLNANVSGFFNNSSSSTNSDNLYRIWTGKKDEVLWAVDISALANNKDEMNKSYDKLREIFENCRTLKSFYNRINEIIEDGTWTVDYRGYKLSKIVDVVYQNKHNKRKTTLWCHQQAILFAAGVKAMFSHYDEKVGDYVLDEGHGDFKFEFWREFDTQPPVYPWRSHYFTVVEMWDGEQIEKKKVDTWKNRYEKWDKNREPSCLGIQPERNSLMYTITVNVSTDDRSNTLVENNLCSNISGTTGLTTSTYSSTEEERGNVEDNTASLLKPGDNVSNNISKNESSINKDSNFTVSIPPNISLNINPSLLI